MLLESHQESRRKDDSRKRYACKNEAWTQKDRGARGGHGTGWGQVLVGWVLSAAHGVFHLVWASTNQSYGTKMAGMTYLDTGCYVPMLASADSFPRPDTCKGSPDTDTPFQ